MHLNETTMTNFDLFTKEKDFVPFADAAVAVERVYAIDPGSVLSSPEKMIHRKRIFI